MMGLAAILYALLFYWVGKNSVYDVSQAQADSLGQAAFAAVTAFLGVLYGCFCLMERRSR